MSSNICGNCGNFKPEPGEKFFNCSSARHAGINYGMQVRADTRSCDAFVPFKASPTPTPMSPRASTTSKAKERPSSEESPTSGERQRPVGLCSRGRAVLMVGLAIAVLLLSWLLYTCASTLVSTPGSTPTPTPRPTQIGTPVPIEYFNVGEWAESSRELVTVSSARRVFMYKRYGQEIRAPGGTVFILIDVTVRNNTAMALSVSPDRFSLLDSEGRVYTQSGYKAEGGFPTGQLLAQGMTNGKVLFTVPGPFSHSGLKVAYTLRGQPPVRARWQLAW